MKKTAQARKGNTAAAQHHARPRVGLIVTGYAVLTYNYDINPPLRVPFTAQYTYGRPEIDPKANQGTPKEKPAKMGRGRGMTMTKDKRALTPRVPEPGEIVIAFPESDREWMSLQQHVIDLTGKPIQDIAWGELGTLRAALTEAEMNAVLSYRRRKRLESSTPFEGIKAARRDPQGWEDWKCDKDYEWMLDFQDTMRALLITVRNNSQHKDYQRLFRRFDRELSAMLNGYPDRAWKPGNDWSLADRLIHDIPMVFPNNEGVELLNKWYDQLDRLWKQLDRRQKKQQAKPAASKDHWLEVLQRRSDDLEKICDKAMEAGLVSSRGSHLYFNGRYLGNGLHNSVWRIVRKDYELEAEIRSAVKNSAGAPQPAKDGMSALATLSPAGPEKI